MTTPGDMLSTVSTVTVPPGPARNLLSNMPSGTIIYNQDKVNTVWISENPSVSPGFGYKLGPLGSMIWAYDGRQCYGCVDTGVTTPVIITYGNSISDLNNPVDVGIAVSTALLQQGIPNVYQETQLASGDVLAPFQSKFYDVHTFASVVIRNNVANSLQGRLALDFLEFSQGIAMATYIMAPDPDKLRFDSDQIAFNVRGYWFEVSNLDATNTATIWLTASNRLRTVDVDASIDSAQPFQWNTASIAMVAGTTYPLTLQQNGVHLTGPVYADFDLNGTVVKGYYQLRYTDGSGTTRSIIIANSTEMQIVGTIMVINKMMALPETSIDIDFVCTTAGTAIASARFISAR